MDNNFEQFRKRFKEEAFDHIIDMEEALLELEKNPLQNELVEKIFRAMHSLKGGGGMFGFEKISEFTHDLETIYDLVRRGNLNVSDDLISLTLKSVDLLRVLLDEKKSERVEIDIRIKAVKQEIAVFAGEGVKKITSQVGMESEGNPHSEGNGMVTYFIHFTPGPDVLENGTKLLYLLDELASLGSAVTFPGTLKVPSFQDVEPTKCYLFWDIILATSKSFQEICDVFIFVEDASEIDIDLIAEQNLLDEDNFLQELKKRASSGKPLNALSVKELISKDEIKQLQVGKSSEYVTTESVSSKNVHTSSLRVSSGKIDELINLVSELVISQERLGLISSQNNIPELNLVANTIQNLTAQLRDSTFSISLLPIEALTMRFRRMIRDLSSELGKEVVFIANGEDTELDKSMIETLTDPLLHILRNSIDHGIETPEEREQAGKPRVGTVVLKAFYSGANVTIEVADDGRGLDASVIHRKAVAKGLIDENASLTDREIFDLVFLPGFSTCEQVSEISGRGVGMDVVKKNIASIRGSVTIDSIPGKGTTISIHLPMVLSIIDGLLVSVGENKFVFPLAVVERIFSVNKQDVQTVFNNIIALEGTQYPFFNLRDCFSVEGELPGRMQAVLVNNSDGQALFSIDKVEGKIQAVLKPLGKFYQDNKFLSAATILADGSIALVLDSNAIISEC